MKFLIVFASLVLLAASQETYTTENDDLDIDGLVADPVLLKAWFSCFVDQGPCDKAQGTFKGDLPEAVQLACSKCTAAQKAIMKKFVIALKEKTPADYEVFRQKYDAENKYFGPLFKALA